MTAPCDLCRRGFYRSFGEHFWVTERGAKKVGLCAAPDETPGAPLKPDAFRERLAAWVERIHAPVVAQILAPVNPNAPGHYTDDEEDDS